MSTSRSVPLDKQAEQQSQTPATGENRLWADLSLLCVALIWGINMPLMKFALSQMDEYLFNLMRLSCSSVVLGVLVFWQRTPLIDRREGASPVRTQVIYIVLFSLLAGFAYQVLFMLGIDATSAGNTALILSTMPMWAALLALGIFKERLSKVAWAGLSIALLGTIVVTVGKNQAGQENELNSSSLGGNLLVCGAAFSWAFASVLSRPIMKSIAPIPLAFCSVTLALPLHLLIAGHALHETSSVLANPVLLSAILYSGIFSTGFAYALYNYGVQQLGAGHATAFQNLVPVVAIVASWFLLSEAPFAIQLLGGALIIAGLVVMRSRRKHLATGGRTKT